MSKLKRREERRILIVELFSQYYFGHLKTLFQPWRDLEQLVINFCEADDCPEKCFVNLQIELAKSIQDTHPSSKYPVPTNCKSEIFSWLKNISKIQNWKNEICDTFTEWETPDESKDCEYIFKTYDYGDEKKVVLLEENRDPLGHGTTGLVSWQGAALLTAWADTFGSDLLRGSHVLELGSGLGLFGMSMLKGQGHQISSFTFTDCHPQVLNFLRINVGLNFKEDWDKEVDYHEWLTNPPCVPSLNFTSPNRDIRVKSLDWTDYEEKELPVNVKVVLGSDLVYSLALLPGLCGLLRTLLQKNVENGCKAIIACTQRNLEHQEKFLETIRAHGMKSELIFKRTFSPEENIMINHEPLKPVNVYEININ